MKLIVLLALALLAGPVHAEPISAALAVIGTAVGASAGAAVMTGLMVAGTAISAVGALTGSKKLARFGGLVSLAGGVGAGFQALSAAAEQAAGSAVAEAAGAEALAATPTAVGAVGEGAASAAASLSTADTLAQTPVAQELMGTGPAAVAAPSGGGGGLVNTAAAGPAAEPAMTDAIMGSQAVQPAASPVADALATASKHVGSFLKDNKELIKLGGGLIEGAMGRSAADSRQQAEFDYLNQRRADYNAGVQGSSVPFRIQGGQNVTDVAPRDPMRFIPTRGLVNTNAGG